MIDLKMCYELYKCVDVVTNKTIDDVNYPGLSSAQDCDLGPKQHQPSGSTGCSSCSGKVQNILFMNANCYFLVRCTPRHLQMAKGCRNFSFSWVL